MIYNNIVNVNWLMQEMKIEVPDRLKVVVFFKMRTMICHLHAIMGLLGVGFESLTKVSEVLAFKHFEGF